MRATPPASFSASRTFPAFVLARRRNQMAMTQPSGGAFGQNIHPRIIAKPRAGGPRAGSIPARHPILGLTPFRMRAYTPYKPEPIMGKKLRGAVI